MLLNLADHNFLDINFLQSGNLLSYPDPLTIYRTIHSHTRRYNTSKSLLKVIHLETFLANIVFTRGCFNIWVIRPSHCKNMLVVVKIAIL